MPSYEGTAYIKCLPRAIFFVPLIAGCMGSVTHCSKVRDAQHPEPSLRTMA
ncbi:MAG: hypothetical protein K0R58_4016, partial [Ramlibacter sp.]|nr:hypothetical protein [Ramlibacter sp.]